MIGAKLFTKFCYPVFFQSRRLYHPYMVKEGTFLWEVACVFGPREQCVPFLILSESLFVSLSHLVSSLIFPQKSNEAYRV